MPDSVDPRPSRRSRRKEARPAEVIEAARDLFIARGYAATKLEDVARKAGVSVGLPYVYFENKEGLFKAVVRDSILPQFRLGEEMLANHAGSTEEFLRILVRTYWELEQRPMGGLCKLMIAEAENFPDLARFYMEEVVVRGRRFFADILRRGVERGEFRPMDVDQMARVLAAPLTMLSLWNRALRPFEPDPAEAAAEPYLDAYLDLVLRGLRASPKDHPDD